MIYLYQLLETSLLCARWQIRMLLRQPETGRETGSVAEPTATWKSAKYIEMDSIPFSQLL